MRPAPCILQANHHDLVCAGSSLDSRAARVWGCELLARLIPARVLDEVVRGRLGEGLHHGGKHMLLRCEIGHSTSANGSRDCELVDAVLARQGCQRHLIVVEGALEH
eukprot:8563313-Lingulodinium_polyedra.AAC.1